MSVLNTPATMVAALLLAPATVVALLAATSTSTIASAEPSFAAEASASATCSVVTGNTPGGVASSTQAWMNEQISQGRTDFMALEVYGNLKNLACAW